MSEIYPAVNRTLAAAAQQHPHYRIVVTGHSLGAAVATLLGMRMREEGYVTKLDIYTYGSPRVGNDALARYIANQKNGREWRVTHAADLVTRPPPLNRGFRHTSPEYWLAAGPSWRVGYGAAQVEECFGYASGGCAAGAPWWIVDVVSHLYYFVAISQCGAGEERLLFAEGQNLWLAGEKGPVNGTTATNSSEGGLLRTVADRVAMYAKLDQEYARALEERGGVVAPVF